MTHAWPWQPLLDGMIEAVWVIDPLEFRVIAANQAATAMLMMEPDALIGKRVIELAVTPEDQYFWEDVAAGLSDTIYSETILLLGDGSTIPVQRRVSPIKLDTSSVVYLVAISSKAEQQRVEFELESLLAELRATLESTADGILVTDRRGSVRSYNRRFAELWNIPQQLMVRRSDGATQHWMARQVLNGAEYESRLEAIEDSLSGDTQDIVTLRNGRILERVSKPQISRGEAIGRVFSFRDITNVLANESRLQLSAKVFGASLDAICVTGPDGIVVSANPTFETLIGFKCDQLGQTTIWELLRSAKHTLLENNIPRQISESNTWEGEVYCRRREGSEVFALASVVRVTSDDDQATLHYIVFLKDLTEKMAAMRRIEELAFTDALTKLPNRVLLHERIDHLIVLCQREQRKFIVAFIDLDRFKQINDSLGHDYGDQVLITIAERLKSCLRGSDTAARISGDEFVLLLYDTDASGAETMIQRVLRRICEPIVFESIRLTVTSSIGLAVYPMDGVTKEDLIKNADTAMYESKARGRSGFRFYQRQMNIDALSRIKLDSAMRGGLEDGQFLLHYQPQIDIASGRIVGAEALLRWIHPELGSVPPSHFIPIAEESGFIVQVGQWVLWEATKQSACWQSKGIDIVIAINVSALQFHSPTFISDVSDALRDTRLEPHRLELELTESILIHQLDETLIKLESLAALGVQLSIDDFGTGYSSMSYLKRFPLHKLKIDQSFIRGLPNDESDYAITRAIVSLGSALRLKVIAEGVETEEQLECLADLGCHEYQGFLVSGAITPEKFEKNLMHTNGAH